MNHRVSGGDVVILRYEHDSVSSLSLGCEGEMGLERVERGRVAWGASEGWSGVSDARKDLEGSTAWPVLQQ